MTWDTALLRADIPVTRRKVYLNTGTLGPSPQTVTVAFVRTYQQWQMEGPGFPRRYHEMRHLLEEARTKLALLLHAPPETIALDGSVTQAINVLAQAIPLEPGDVVIVGSEEHPANRYPWRALESMGRVAVRVWPMAPDDDQLLEELEQLLAEPRVRLVSVSHILQTNGRILPIRRIAALCRSRTVPLLVDGAQAVGQIPVDLTELDVDAYAFTGHKWLLGPVGTGGFYVHPRLGARLGLLPAGSGSAADDHSGRFGPDVPFLEAPRRFEVGTANWPLYHGLAVAIDILLAIGLPTVLDTEERLRRGFLSLLPAGVAPVPVPQAAGMVSVTLPLPDPEAAVETLYRRHGIVVRHVPELPNSTLRFSFAAFNTEEDVARCLVALRELLGRA